ncbi:MAG: CRISPR-associated helicase Cas3' [Clostridiales bacterium]|nr:CRISPR-associated helicase Cas3' [Clostridiales bacterium]
MEKKEDKMTEAKLFAAHIDSEGNEQSVKDHLTGTAKRTGEFAAEFGCREMGYHCGLMHDIGKYSAAFQKRIHNPEKYGKVDHSTAGAKETNNPLEGMVIAGHHSGLMDGGNRITSFTGDGTYFGRMKSAIPDYSNWKEDLSEILKCNFRMKLPDYVRNGGFSAAFFMRMLYSCLVDADYLDTERFMDKDKAENRSGYDTFETLIGKFNGYIESWLNPAEPVKPLYQCRTKILKECMEKGELFPKGLYTLTVPTGGGKTTASMGFALRHVGAHNNMKRIIYVIPYTSIIDQTAETFSSVFGRSNVVEHHSGLILDLDENNCDPWQIRNVLATENWDAPVIVTTAVQFFESLFSNKSSKCRKLHNLCNSVIIFDEAQTLPVPYLKPCIAAIAQLVQNYGATAVLCTATQPALGSYFREYMSDLELQEICGNCSKEENAVFERVTINNLGVLTKAQLESKLNEYNQVLCIVNRKATAQELYHCLGGDGWYCLTTLIYPAERKKKIAEIKQRLKDGRPCKVISTSLIEAGVDLDFPVVYREEAGLDSLIQAAGRCNREGKRPKELSEVFSFSLEEESNPSMEQSRGALRETMRKYEKVNSLDAIAFYFQYYRELLGQENLDEKGLVKIWDQKENLFPFATAARLFKMIEDDTRTIYIPADETAGEYLRRIEAGYADRATYRKLQQYGVPLPEYQFQKMMEQGLLKAVTKNVYELNDMRSYDSQTGLQLEVEMGIGIFFD